MAFDYCNLGDSPRVYVEFRDALTGDLMDPDSVSLSVKSPDGVLTTVAYSEETSDIIKDDVGQYHAFIDANQSGTWFYRWWAAGNGQSAEERRFIVREANAQ